MTPMIKPKFYILLSLLVRRGKDGESHSEEQQPTLFLAKGNSKRTAATKKKVTGLCNSMHDVTA